jgi:hypothetical protein
VWTGSLNHSTAATTDNIALHAVEFELHPGDGCFIPEGWWHQVDSAPGSIAVNAWMRGAGAPLTDFYADGSAATLVQPGATKGMDGTQGGVRGGSDCTNEDDVMMMLGPTTYLDRLVVAVLTQQQLAADRAACMKGAAADAASVAADLLASTVDALAQYPATTVHGQAMSLLRGLCVCAETQDSGSSLRGRVFAEVLTRLATDHTHAWRQLLVDLDPTTADALLTRISSSRYSAAPQSHRSAAASASADSASLTAVAADTDAPATTLQDVVFSVFEDGGIVMQRMLLERAEKMARAAWQKVVVVRAQNAAHSVAK